MYKTVSFVLIVLVGIACGSKANSNSIQRVKPSSPVGLDFCPTCINLAGDSINELLELILNVGVIGTCQSLCDALAEKTSAAAGVICDLVCTVVGIKEFIDLIENADLDPIWYCEIAKACPINDHGNANITVFSILPATGPKGTTFAIDFTYVSTNGTGTGEIVIDIHTPDRIPLGAGFLAESKKPGTYTERITVKAEPDPQCDPTQEPCEQWLPGTYNVTVEICNGECGSKHPHYAVYDRHVGSFQVTA